MSIMEIKQYMEENKKASLDELCSFFSVEKNTMEDALNMIIKSEESSLFKKGSCGQCKKCSCHTKKNYSWIN